MLADRTAISIANSETGRMLVAPLEVSVRSGADWERAILTGYRAWNQLQAAQAASSS